MVELNVYRAGDACNNSCLVLRLQPAVCVDSDWATENEAGRWWELSLIQFSCDCNYSLITHNKTPVHSTWGLLRVCLRPAQLPVLTWVPSSVSPGTISKICSSSGPQQIQQHVTKTMHINCTTHHKQHYSMYLHICIQSVSPEIQDRNSHSQTKNRVYNGHRGKTPLVL